MKEIICKVNGNVLTVVSNETYEELVNGENALTSINGVKFWVANGEFYGYEVGLELFETCSQCGAFIDKEADEYVYFDGECYCETCRDEQLVFCEHCHEYFNADDAVEVHVNGSNTEYWCEECVDDYAFRCDDCDEYYSNRDFYSYETVSGETVCENCRDHYSACDNCGDLCCEDELVYDEVDDAYYCNYCYERRQRERANAGNFGAHIVGYHSYSNNWHFNGDADRKKNLHIGVELEIDAGGESDSNAVAITSALGFPFNESGEFKCSHDGSLRNGFEIISQPSTLEFHSTHYKWAEGLQKASSLGYKGHDVNTAGIHHHVDREYFKDSMVNPETGFAIVVANNSEWIKNFSRRRNFSYCSFGELDYKFSPEDFKGENAEDTQERLYSMRRGLRGHGEALNFENNATIELRFYKSTLNPETFMANLQFTEMLSYAVKHFREEQLCNVDFRWFKNMASHRGYDQFLAYCERRGIMG